MPGGHNNTRRDLSILIKPNNNTVAASSSVSFDCIPSEKYNFLKNKWIVFVGALAALSDNWAGNSYSSLGMRKFTGTKGMRKFTGTKGKNGSSQAKSTMSRCLTGWLLIKFQGTTEDGTLAWFLIILPILRSKLFWNSKVRWSDFSCRYIIYVPSVSCDFLIRFKTITLLGLGIWCRMIFTILD